MKLHRYDYDTVDGKMVEVKCDEIYAWVGVNTKTGEVELGDIRQFDDNLEPLALGWKWVRFTMTPSEVMQPMIANQEFNYMLEALRRYRNPLPHLSEYEAKEARLMVVFIEVLLDQLYPRGMWEKYLEELPTLQ